MSPASDAGALEAIRQACASPSRAALSSVVDSLAKLFRVTTNEVALLRIDGQNLVFIVPERLRRAGTIPLSASTGSVAARTATTRRPELLNNFQSTRHAAIFEGVKLSTGPAAAPTSGAGRVQPPLNPGDGPIQKMMSVPVLRENRCIGVVQVSRKGRDIRGLPDFTTDDLTALTEVSKLLGELIASTAQPISEP